MTPFQLLSPATVAEASALLAVNPAAARVLAGGSDLLSEIKEGVEQPQQLINLAVIPGLSGVAVSADSVTIGAMTTIAAVAAHPVIAAEFAALAQAAGGLATPQIRNVGTLGGNLCQRPRCLYYRHPLTNCLKKGGTRCFALAGTTRNLCVVGGERCYIVHPSDTAVALLALGASVTVAGAGGARTLPIGEFFIGPAQDVLRETILRAGELVTQVTLPRANFNWRSVYLKARERESGDFALVSVAAAVVVEGGIIRRAGVALGGVAPVPYSAERVVGYLRGKAPHEVDPAAARALALPQARPFPDNAYKVTLAQNLVSRAVRQIVEWGVP